MCFLGRPRCSRGALRRVGQLMLPTAHHAGDDCTQDGRDPKQPELRDVSAAGKQRRSGASRRVDGGVRDRDEEQMNESEAEPDGYARKPDGRAL
jgi:hypothetical protein